MNKKIKPSFIIVLIFLIFCTVVILKIKTGKVSSGLYSEIKPTVGSIQLVISTTGTVYPKNRLEIKPPVSGRIETVLVKEGENVKIGQTLAWMSSTERAALLDAASSKGEEQLKYWQDAYKPIALLAHINGEVIVSTMQPGQTVTASDAVIVLSDRLIVRAQVDETDIGSVKLGQNATIILDAYPDTRIKAAVDHIYYESETINNVTIYKVDLIPEEVPEDFRSGMNATIDFIVEAKKDALLIPVETVHKEEDKSYVLLKQDGSKEPVKRLVILGITDDKSYEVLSGITAKDTIISVSKEYTIPVSNSTGSNPFMPKFRSSKGASR